MIHAQDDMKKLARAFGVPDTAISWRLICEVDSAAVVECDFRVDGVNFGEVFTERYFLSLIPDDE